MGLRSWLGRDKTAEKEAERHQAMNQKELEALQRRLRLLQVEVNVIIREEESGHAV